MIGWYFFNLPITEIEPRVAPMIAAIGHTSISFYFVFLQTVNRNYWFNKSCRWLDSNRGPLVSEATALPTEPPQPLPPKYYLSIDALTRYLTFVYLRSPLKIAKTSWILFRKFLLLVLAKVNSFIIIIKRKTFTGFKKKRKTLFAFKLNLILSNSAKKLVDYFFPFWRSPFRETRIGEVLMRHN